MVVTQQKPEKNSHNFEIFCSLWFFFSVFFGFFVVVFRFFFRCEIRQEIQPFKNHVNNEILRGQELPNNTLNACKVLQMSYKSYSLCLAGKADQLILTQ